MKRIRRVAFTLTTALTLAFSGAAYANHPVLVEGNCDSPNPATTSVAIGTCGDFDGDGLIGTAEDTDGADRIFGTLTAAIGPGSGPAAGTGANSNGTVLIVTSGRFVEPSTLTIPDAASGPTHLTIEAAPGVVAVIGAVLQGDPAGGNVARQMAAGINITATGGDDRIVLRNLSFQNWSEAVRISAGATVTIDNCKFERNLDYAIRVMGTALLIVHETTIMNTGTRAGSVGSTPFPGRAISFENASRGLVTKSFISGSAAEALANTSSLGVGAVSHYQLVVGLNGGGIVNATAINY